MDIEEIYKRYKKSNKYVMFLDITDIKFLFDEIERLKKENGRLIYEKQEIICFEGHKQFKVLEEENMQLKVRNYELEEKLQEIKEVVEKLKGR